MGSTFNGLIGLIILALDIWAIINVFKSGASTGAKVLWILLILIGMIFVIETVSVILQVGSYKLRNKRVFLMAPIHHHYEMKKWAENKIIVRFWMISFLANIVALITLKIR